LKENEEQKVKLRKYMERIESSENWRDKNYKPIWERCYKRYRNHVDPILDSNGKEVKDRSNISIPYTFTQVETILPRLVESLFAARPYVTVKGREEMDQIAAENMETLLDYQMNERMDMQDIFHLGLKGMCIYGTAVAFTGWKYKERTSIKRVQAQVYEIDPETDEPIIDPNTMELIPLMDEDTPIMDWQEEEVNEIEYDDPEVKFLDLGLFYVDTNATDIEDSRYCGHSCYMTKAEIDALAETDDDIEINWKEIPKDSKKNTARNQRMSSVGLGSGADENIHDDEDALYEVHYYFEDNKEVLIINREYLAKDSTSRFHHRKKPYVKDVYTEVPHEFYGMGVVEVIEDLQDELNAERNMRIDYRAMSMRRMWKVKKGSMAASQNLTWRQNGRIYVESEDELEVLEAPDGALSGSFNQESTIKQDMRDTSGAHDVVMGTSGGSSTATETMTKDNNASMRFKLVISSIEKRLLVGIATFMIQLNQQFIDNERVMRIVGEQGDQWIEMAPEDIQGEFDLVAAGSSVEPMANKEAYKQRMVELYSIAANDPFMQQFPQYRRNLLKKVYEAFDIKNFDDLLPSDEELMMQQPPPMGAPNVPQMGGGSNTSMMQEQGLNVIPPLRGVR
jgi:hypothetical protein